MNRYQRQTKTKVLSTKVVLKTLGQKLGVPQKKLKAIVNNIVRASSLTKTECLNLMQIIIEKLKNFSKKQKLNSTDYAKEINKWLKQNENTKNCLKPIYGLRTTNCQRIKKDSLALFLFKIRKLAPETKMC